MPDLPQVFGKGMSLDETQARLTDMVKQLNDEGRTKLIYNTGVPQILIGYQKGGFTDANGNLIDYGIKVSRINPATGVPYNVTTATDEQLQFTTSQDTRLFYNQGVPQVLTGFQDGGFGAMGDYGIKSSKINPGTGLPYDVRTANDQQIGFSTGFNQLRVAKSGDITLSAGTGASDYETINHGLVDANGNGVTPAVLVYAKVAFDGYLVGDFWVPLPQDNAAYTIFAAADETTFNVELDVSISGGDYTIPIRYYLLTETLS